MERLLSVLPALALVFAALAVAAQAAEVVIEATVGPDGYAVASALLPPGSYTVKAVEGGGAGAPAAANARPLLLALSPDPVLWERLASVAVAVPPLEGARVVIDETSWGVAVSVVAPGEPGARVRVVLEAQQASTAVGGVDMIIVVPDEGFLDAAGRLAGLHERQGLRVKVLTMREVLERYQPAGRPGSVCPGDRLPGNYSLDAALRLLSLAREAASSGARYLLLVGGAGQVPPLYYCSPLLSELVSPSEGVVPSDYYYADPDGDGVAELAVGRLPFTEASQLSRYIDALEKWSRGGDWQRRSLLAGGAPFAYVFLTGEAAASQASRALSRLGVKVDWLLLTSGNYEGSRLAPYLGRYGLYYVVAHGTGSSLLDYVPGGVWNYDFEEKLRSSEVSHAAYPGVWMLPACRDGYWDTDLVEPPFQPPSLAQALLENGAAVAYLGYARIAIEVIDAVSVSSGRLDLGLAGADRLLLEFLRSLPGSQSLGEAWVRALNAYAALPQARYRAYLLAGEEEIGSLVLHEAVFLGDPAAPNPWGTGRKPGFSAPTARLEPGLSVGAAVVAERLARYSGGSLPAAKPGGDGEVTLVLTGECPSILYSHGIQRVDGAALVDLVEDEVLGLEELNGSCAARIRVAPGAPGLHVATAIYGDGGIEHFYYIVAGAVYNSGSGVVSFYGLDLLSPVGNEPVAITLDGKLLAVAPGGSPGYTLPAPSEGGVLEARPVHDNARVLGGPLVAGELEKLLPLYRVELPRRPSPGPLGGLAAVLAAAALIAAARRLAS